MHIAWALITLNLSVPVSTKGNKSIGVVLRVSPAVRYSSAAIYYIGAVMCTRQAWRDCTDCSVDPFCAVVNGPIWTLNICTTQKQFGTSWYTTREKVFFSSEWKTVIICLHMGKVTVSSHGIISRSRDLKKTSLQHTKCLNRSSFFTHRCRHSFITHSFSATPPSIYSHALAAT